MVSMTRCSRSPSQRAAKQWGSGWLFKWDMPQSQACQRLSFRHADRMRMGLAPVCSSSLSVGVTAISADTPSCLQVRSRCMRGSPSCELVWEAGCSGAPLVAEGLTSSPASASACMRTCISTSVERLLTRCCQLKWTHAERTCIRACETSRYSMEWALPEVARCCPTTQLGVFRIVCS